MKRSVLQPFLVVFCVWFVGLWVFGGMPTSLPDTDKMARVAIMAALVSFGAVVARLSYRTIIKKALEGRSAKDAASTIGPVPGYMPPERAEKVPAIDRARWPATRRWLDAANDEYRDLFRAILGAMAVKPNLPASPEPTGHGGCTLIEHSLNVVETGLRELDYWTVDRKNHQNEGMPVPPESRELVPLVLLAHDLGKIVAFKTAPGDDSQIIGKKSYHDRESARLVALMEESWALSEDEHNDLIMAVSHEHHPQDMPLHASDQARILMEFLIHADRLASANEDRVYHGEQPLYSDEVGDPASVVSEKSTSEAKSEAASSDHPREQLSRGGGGNQGGSPAHDAQSTAEMGDVGQNGQNDQQSETPAQANQADHPDQLDRAVQAEYEQMWDWLRDLIARPHTVNGNSKQYRLAFWDGKRLYINEAKLRTYLAEEFYADPERGRETLGDGRYKITKPFLEALDHVGVLVKTFDGKEWNAKNALFRVAASDPKTGKTLNASLWNAAIVLEFPPDKLPVVLTHLDPAPKPPKIIKARWPQHALRGGSADDTDAPEASDAPESADAVTDEPVQEGGDETRAAQDAEPEGWGAAAAILPEGKGGRSKKRKKPAPEPETPADPVPETTEAKGERDAPEPSADSVDDPIAALDPLAGGSKPTKRKKASRKPPQPDSQPEIPDPVEMQPEPGQGENQGENQDSGATDSDDEFDDFTEDDLYAQYEDVGERKGDS